MNTYIEKILEKMYEVVKKHKQVTIAIFAAELGFTPRTISEYMDMLPIKYKDVQIVYINRKKYAVYKK
jgi:predicted DNA-binding transcriptional regulator YafY